MSWYSGMRRECQANVRHGARRAFKRWERKQGNADHVHNAYLQGGHDAWAQKPYRNPYPAGRRHDEYDRGFNGG